MPETSMQNNRGSLRSASAACNLCLARTWGGAGGRTDAATCLRRHQTKAQPMTASMAAAARIHQSQAQLLGISTGGLMARISFVRATGDGGGTISAELFVIIERKSCSAVAAAAFRLLPLPTRNERGEGRGEGKALKTLLENDLPFP